MRLPWPHRDGDPRDGDRDGRDRDGRVREDQIAAIPVTPVPSPTATDRLAERLHREVEDLRSDLTNDLLLSLILLGEDEVEGALGLLEDGSDRLHRFQDRVEGVIADAAVERDAEGVLAELAMNPEPAIEPDPPADPEPALDSESALDPESARTRFGTAFRIRVVASTAAAVLAAVVALVSVEPPNDPSLVAARTSSPAPTSGPAQTAVDLAPGRSSDGMLSSSGGGQVSPTATTPSDRLQALRVIGDQGGILARLGSEPRRTAVAALFGVERLVDQVVTDAGSTLPSETVEAVTESLPEVEVPIEDSSVEPATEPRPRPQPTTEEAPSEEPSEQTTTDEPTQDGSEEPRSEEPSSEESEEPSEESTGEDSDNATGTLTGEDSGWGSSATDDESSVLP